MAAIEVQGLTKTYRAVTAVDDLSFEVADGSVFAFLGENGAGKSTTINCLTTVLAFDQGAVAVAGHDVVRDGEAVRTNIGVVFQESLLDPMLTVRENLRLRATLAGLDRPRADIRIGELAELIGLDEFLDRRYGRLSGGQKRRVDIARALVHEPAIVFLDEPTAGLDPVSRSLVWRTLHRLREQTGLTIFLTTHYMEETEEADRVCVIDHGRIVADDTPTALRARYSRSILSVRTTDTRALQQAVSSRRGVRIVSTGDLGAADHTAGDVVDVAVTDAATARAILAELGEGLVDFEFRHGRMDDVFLALTGREADGGGTQESAA